MQDHTYPHSRSQSSDPFLVSFGDRSSVNENGSSAHDWRENSKCGTDESENAQITHFSILAFYTFLVVILRVWKVVVISGDLECARLRQLNFLWLKVSYSL